MFTVCWTQFLFFVGVGSRLFLITCPKAVLRSLDVHEFRCLWLNTVQLVHGFSVFLYTQLKVQKTPRRNFWHLNVQHPMLGGKTHSRPLSVIICGISFCPAVVLVLKNHNRAVLISHLFQDTRVKGSVCLAPEILKMSCQCGSQLVNWHPWESYISTIFCGDIHLHKPYIGLIYGRYLQFSFLKLPIGDSN